jgi:type I restriction enzyme M protein
LFNGGAGSGESEIRRWLLENDLVEAIVALPTEIFFRTGIGTYLWILSNKKDGRREKRVQLINATASGLRSRTKATNAGSSATTSAARLSTSMHAAENGEVSRMIDYRTFGYRRIKVLRPLRMSLVIDESGPGQAARGKGMAEAVAGTSGSLAGRIAAAHGRNPSVWLGRNLCR